METGQVSIPSPSGLLIYHPKRLPLTSRRTEISIPSSSGLLIYHRSAGRALRQQVSFNPLIVGAPDLPRGSRHAGGCEGNVSIPSSSGLLIYPMVEDLA